MFFVADFADGFAVDADVLRDSVHAGSGLYFLLDEFVAEVEKSHVFGMCLVDLLLEVEDVVEHVGVSCLLCCVLCGWDGLGCVFVRLRAARALVALLCPFWAGWCAHWSSFSARWFTNRAVAASIVPMKAQDASGVSWKIMSIVAFLVRGASLLGIRCVQLVFSVRFGRAFRGV